MDNNSIPITLTPRLTTIADLLSKGMSRKAIALELDLSIHTVNGYVKEVYTLFGVHSHVEFVISYVRFLDREVHIKKP